MAGFASGLNAGIGLVSKLKGLYDMGQQQRAVGEVNDATPETSNEFTPEDGQRLEAIATTKDANGGSFYTLQGNDKGGYDVALNPDAMGPIQDKIDPATFTGGVNPKQYTDYLGTRVEGELSPTQQRSIKRAAMAKAIAPYDPKGAAKMEDDAASFDEEAKLRQLKIAEANAALRKGERESEIQKRMDLYGKMTPEEIHNTLTGDPDALNNLGIGVTQGEDGAYPVDLGGGNRTTLSPLQARGVAMGAKLYQDGFVPEGLAYMMNGNKEVYTQYAAMRAAALADRKADQTDAAQAETARHHQRALDMQKYGYDSRERQTRMAADARIAAGAAHAAGAASYEPRDIGATTDRNGKTVPSVWANQSLRTLQAKLKNGEISTDEYDAESKKVVAADANWFKGGNQLVQKLRANPGKAAEIGEEATQRGYPEYMISLAMERAGVSRAPTKAQAVPTPPDNKLPPPRPAAAPATPKQAIAASPSAPAPAPAPAPKKAPPGGFFAKDAQERMRATKAQTAADDKGKRDKDADARSQRIAQSAKEKELKEREALLNKREAMLRATEQEMAGRGRARPAIDVNNAIRHEK